jgi:uncharacterized membrane protein YphA (DoxX/SURF4 family)
MRETVGMRNLLTSAKSTDLGLLLARAPLGLWLVISGFMRFTATGGVDGFADRAAGHVPTWIPQAVARQYFHAMPFGEIVVGAALALGIGGRVGGLFGAILLGTLLVLVDGVRYGAGAFNPAIGFVGVALLVFLAGPGEISMDKVMWRQASAAGSAKKSAARD